MDAAPILTPMQLSIIWALLSMLLLWMVIFAILAIRSRTPGAYEHEEFSSESAMLHTQEALTAPSTLNALSSETSGEVGAAHIA